MKKFILGLKGPMTQIFNEQGEAVPVTVVSVEPNFVTAIRNLEKDGYDSVAISFGEQKESRISKALLGHLKKPFRYTREFRLEKPAEFKVGDEINLEIFEKGEKIEVSSISKGKGFQGAVKRWNFAGGRRSHGNKHAEREVGSIGAGTTPGRVWKGKKMPGRMGSDRITFKNLKVAGLDAENNRIFIKGSFAGKKGQLVEIKIK